MLNGGGCQDLEGLMKDWLHTEGDRGTGLFRVGQEVFRHDRMTTSDSLLTDLMDSANKDNLLPGMSWQPDIRGRSLQFVGFR